MMMWVESFFLKGWFAAKVCALIALWICTLVLGCVAGWSWYHVLYCVLCAVFVVALIASWVIAYHTPWSRYERNRHKA